VTEGIQQSNPVTSGDVADQLRERDRITGTVEALGLALAAPPDDDLGRRINRRLR
jgi:hypothetical protein